MTVIMHGIIAYQHYILIYVELYQTTFIAHTTDQEHYPTCISNILSKQSIRLSMIA